MTENEKAKQARKKILERNKDFIRRIKEGSPCVDCGKMYHYSQMDFDHIAGKKKNSIARLSNSAASIKTIKEEMSKCELVCSNCHRFRTWDRYSNS